MRRLAALVAAGALAAGAVTAAPAQAAPDGDGLVIGEVYLNGGSAGASYLNKFVELTNPTDEDIDVSGWSVQYRSYSSTGSFTGVIALGEHHVEPGGTLLVSGNNNADNGAALPTPDVTSTVSFSGNSNGGTIALSRSTTALSGDRAAVLGSGQVVDLVGYGASNTFEGAAPAPREYSVTASLQRSAAADSDDNAADLRGAAPTPQACGAACDGGVVTPPEPATEATIAEIQGDGDTSPLAGRTVTTRGVVTAAYPSGGFNGAYIQTGGTGGDVDLSTHDASDGLFVFSSAFGSGVEIGDSVEVTGLVSEYQGLTELTTAAGGWTALAEPLEAVEPTAVAFPLDEAQRESLEGTLLAPTGRYTVADNYTTNPYAEIGIASGTEPLAQPTNVARPGSPEAAAVAAANATKAVRLDDGASINFFSAANQGIALPWLTRDNEVRVGAPVTFTDPMVLDFRNSAWKLQPTSQLAAGGDEPVTFGSTRTARPEAVGGEVKIATFNVLNYFTTLGEEYTGGTCSYYRDRFGANVTVNSCTNNGPRGAANAENLGRQQAKIVAAINALGADVVTLEEIENSAAFGQDRDTALDALVAALNADAGAGTWTAVGSPAAGIPENEDVIRTAFIYRTAAIETVGSSTILADPAFDNARRPLAQTFRPAGGDAGDDFVTIVNHFKSKGSGEGDDADTGDGQGASNASRVRQAKALVAFADAQKAAAGTDRIFLTGDFNSYAQEDPVKVIEDAGYLNVPSKFTDKQTYLFGGLIGSLDHVFASPAAMEKVTGADIWNINAYESVGREYSRHLYNATDLYRADTYRASDHDPAIIGFDASASDPEPELGPTRIEVTDSSGPPRPSLSVTVKGGDIAGNGGVLLVLDGWRPVGLATVREGQATVRLFGVGLGKRTLTLIYSGDRSISPAATLYRYRG